MRKMGKISPVSAKYIVHATIQIEGVVDRPDVIGAIFGQTEGLLGADLELRELQRSGRIGRIEVTADTRAGKTQGSILIPSSLDKAETSIVGAALEVIQRIGPCNAKIKVTLIEDVRVSKRQFVIERAKELLKEMMDSVMPDSQELADEVAQSVRVMEIQEYGKDRLPAGPNVEDSDEILIVEGRADVLNLLKHGIKNSVAINGTSIPETIVELCNRKIVTMFVDGDRGGDLIIKELTGRAEVDFVTKAPDGKEVEEITKKEIHKALRARVSPEQAKDVNGNTERRVVRKPTVSSTYQRPAPRAAPQRRSAPSAPIRRPVVQTPKISLDEKKKFGKMLEDLIGTRGAYILDNKLSILGKVPFTELVSTMKSLSTGVYAVVFDGDADADVLGAADKIGVSFVIGMGSKVKPMGKVSVLTVDDL
jgi:DNA primase